MIEDGFGYLALLVMISSIVVYSERHYRWKLFEYLPAIVIIYFVVMVLSTVGLWSKTPDITATYKSIKSNILPAMIFLLLLQADLRDIAKIGKKMLLTFVLASVSIALGFVGMFVIFHNFFEPDAWRAFAALSGSWMGGSANMVAIQGALEIPDTKMGYVLLIDSIDYAIWVMILLALVPLAKRFDQWSGADSSTLQEVGERLTLSQTKDSISFHSIFLLLGVSLAVSAMSQYLSAYLPTNSFVTQTTWVVIVATIAGTLAAMTPLSKEAGANELGNISLYIVVALIASRANFYELTQAPLYIIAGFVIISIHVVSMVIFAKLFRLDLFSLGVASLANIGGVASAPILAGAYSKALIPIGVLMAMMGYIVGTFGGLAVGKMLEMIAT
ncbi:DUF819 domain-containing protein [hydrothermal vent metagenome]|uniref:DUF819 domain-containing protein n=1 Tax=hydrothermal vent metagenome TaxID=652676 RepID=A0A1W1BB75_9ZZZZ